MIAGLILAVWLVAVQDRQSDPSAELSAARSLYATAAYEDALDRLNRIRSTDALRDQVDTYKALCLLALGRTRDSEKMIEQILARNPQYVPSESEVSPRLMVVFKRCGHASCRARRAACMPRRARISMTRNTKWLRHSSAS
jgi:tetratricopeptide (TPR) repeat protein